MLSQWSHHQQMETEYTNTNLQQNNWPRGLFKHHEIELPYHWIKLYERITEARSDQLYQLVLINTFSMQAEEKVDVIFNWRNLMEKINPHN